MKTLKDIIKFLSELCAFEYKIILLDNSKYAQLIECDNTNITDFLDYEVLEINDIAIQPSSNSFNYFNLTYREPHTLVFVFIKLDTVFS